VTPLRATVITGTALSVLGTALTMANVRHLRRPSVPTTAVDETVSILIPTRNEAPRVASCLMAALEQSGLSSFEVIVLDDGSRDGTAQIAHEVANSRSNVVCRILEHPDVPPPQGWIGKPWASSRLSDEALGSVLVFVDADVILEPNAVASAVTLLRELDLDLISPYPRQRAHGLLPRLIQPLLQWSWMTTVPLRASERSTRESLAVANGQFMVIDAAAYRRAGGFAAVRSIVLDDVAMLRAIKRSGGTGTVVDGTHLATCRMYDTSTELVDGYAKSLWSAFGSAAGSVGVMSLLTIVYIVPPVAALVAPSPTTRLIGLGGYSAAVLGRVIVARTTGQRVFPDVLAHPASVAGLAALTAVSWTRRRRGTLTWKGRGVSTSHDVSGSDVST